MNIFEFINLKNLYKSPITTVVGLALLGLVARKYWIERTLDANDMALLTLGSGLLFAKDPTQVKPGAGAATLLMSVVMLSGCTTYKRCIEKYGSGEGYEITIRDTITVHDTIPQPEKAIDGQIKADSLLDLLNGKIDTISKTDADMQIKFWRDRYTKALKYKAKTKPDTIIWEKLVPVEVKGDCTDTHILDPRKDSPWHRQLWDSYRTVAGWVVLAQILLIVLLLLYNKFVRR